MNRDLVRQIVNVAAYVVMIGMNAAAEIVPLNGQTSGEISDRFPIYFVPAGYVFSIWSVIYVFLLAFTVYQALPAQRANAQLRRIGWLFALSCLLNAAWLVLWHYNLFALTVVVMLALLGTLILIYQRLDIGRTSVSRAEQWLVHVPFSIYLGWITVATIANISDEFYALGWNGQPFPPEWWAVAMLVVATGLALWILRQRTDIAYALVIVWAFVGIFVKQSATPLVAWTALFAAVVVGLGLVLQARRGLQPRAVAP